MCSTETSDGYQKLIRKIERSLSTSMGNSSFTIIRIWMSWFWLTPSRFISHREASTPSSSSPSLPNITSFYKKLLIYTGITRAKKLVVLVGTKKALAIAIKNNKPQTRYTCLCRRLMN